MTYIPITPFRRAMTPALVEHQRIACADLPPEGVNKYEVVRELTAARKALGLHDRALAVLQALLSFHPKTILGGNSADLLVYPSNAAICERLNGMACSTMRRHLSSLVDSGLILRRDSPNGKRYVKRYGGEAQAFGFDLTPLVARFAEVCAVAEAARAEEERYQRLRRTVSLMRRDLAGLAVYGADTRPDLSLWDAFSDLAALTARDLRRNLTFTELEQIELSLHDALDAARDVIDLDKTVNMNTNGADIEQHHQNSNEDSYDLEPSLEKEKAGEAAASDDSLLPNIPLGLVMSTCHEIKTYTEEEIRHWHQLVRAAHTVRPMMGISTSAWDEAVDAMGPEETAVVVATMLERFSEIGSPGGYLRALARKAGQGAFSCGPMVMALLRKEAA